MTFSPLLVGAVVATLAMTTVMSGSQMWGLSRMSLPFMLGTMLTKDRDRAMPIGFGMHMINGIILSLLYFSIFRVFGASWWMGLCIGVGHFLAVFLVVMPLLPGVHPRMASERDGPEPTRALEPPGYFGLNYGTRTPIVGLVAHALYGVILGIFCQVGG